MQFESPSPQAEKKLLQSFRQGDPEAMQAIVNYYERSLYNFGLRICGQKQDAEDILQDTFLSAFRSLQDFRGESSLKTWLFKIAAHACFKKRRKKKCEPDYELSLESLLPASQEQGEYDIPDLSTDPSKSLLDSELKNIILEGMQALPPIYRMVFNLRDLEGFSTEQTAQIMDLTPQAIKTRLHRARLFLRKTISERYRKDSSHA